jgi:hypothetical protein
MIVYFSHTYVCGVKDFDSTSELELNLLRLGNVEGR